MKDLGVEGRRCEHCGREFDVKVAALRRGAKGRFCSRRCVSRWLAANQVSSVSPAEKKRRKKIYDVKRYSRSRVSLLAAIRERTQGIRLSAIFRYSNGSMSCLCCGTKYLPFLTIDHIDGGGAKHRRSLKTRGGSSFFRWLANNAFPEGFRILCWNCNRDAFYNSGKCGCGG